MAKQVLSDLTVEGLLSVRASLTSGPSLRIPHGVAPTSPTNGDIWTTTAGIYARINGVTKQLDLAGGGGGDTVVTGTVTINFGTKGYAASATVTDPTVTSASVVVATLGSPVAGRQADELEFTSINPAVVVNDGVGFTITGYAPNGANGQFNINYMIK